MTDDESPGSHELLEDVIILNGVVDRALYQAFRYYSTGYDHKREDTLEELETLRECIDEVLEGHREKGDSDD